MMSADFTELTLVYPQNFETDSFALQEKKVHQNLNFNRNYAIFERINKQKTRARYIDVESLKCLFGTYIFS